MMNRIAALLAVVAAVSLSPTGLRAQVAMDDLVRVHVLDGGQTGSGTYMSALRLVLSDGWKTYWRAPGDAGIPPQFDWSGSSNIGKVSYHWPTPHVFDQNGVQSIGYDRQLVLPVEVTPRDPSQPVRLKGTVEIGLCKDVCIPGTLTVDHTLDAKAGRHPAIAAAMAQRPYSRGEAGVSAATCRLSPTSDGMRIEARITMPSSGGTEVAVIEPGSALIWASPAETRRQGNVLFAASDLVHVKNGPLALDRSAIRITVLGKRHAVDIVGCSPG
ncbi:protein-disulfide reductase DsbD domain-containing protein [Sedimentitalea arenosa]|uniref:Thiol:disulfide interchange protein DsbD N-terminal domain-containing protein n=1 Tax=Sedimentitalea arenosa TaxID=2798803 RepID=A0A8J7LZM1_9RHOB|nr:protein-disulfide reductase DsbD domain-containing protein [Arenibacterium arenosum]MBJ6371261.1 hypothetical protein [Arenibacterium arenosum]